MADLYTGKYLDGAGLQILWNKLKATFASLTDDNNFTGTNTFAKTIVVPGVKTAAGDNTKLFADGGGFVNVSDFATAGHNHDDVYVNVTGDTMTGALTIGSSEAAANLTVYGTGTFSDYVTAKGFKVGAQTGFLKADGSVDTNIYALKSDFDDHNHDTVYAKLAADNTLTGANVFTHVDGVKAKKFVVDGGTADNLLLANGALKSVYDFATAISLQNAEARIGTIEANYVSRSVHNADIASVESTANAYTDEKYNDAIAYTDTKVSNAIDTAIGNLGTVLEFKGSVSAEGDLPTGSVELGWTYVVAVAGTYAGEVCEVGDMLICTEEVAGNPTWTIIQRNIPGVLTEADINSILV